MSVRFRSVNMFDSGGQQPVADRVPEVEHAVRAAPPRKREPKTTSALPSSSGASRSPYSRGSYSRSASCTITYGAGRLGEAAPQRGALALVDGLEQARGPVGRRRSAQRSRRVPSVDPSSTTISSCDVRRREHLLHHDLDRSRPRCSRASRPTGRTAALRSPGPV